MNAPCSVPVPLPRPTQPDEDQPYGKLVAMTPGETTAETTFRAAIPLRYRVILGTLGFVAVAGSAVAALEGGTAALVTAAFIAVVFVPVLLMTAKVSLSGQGIGIRVAGFFSTEVPYREITAVTAGPMTGLREGMGLRILPDGTGYLVGGPSVRIETGKTAVLVSCSHPERLIAAVSPHLPGPGPNTCPAERGQGEGLHR